MESSVILLLDEERVDPSTEDWPSSLSASSIRVRRRLLAPLREARGEDDAGS